MPRTAFFQNERCFWHSTGVQALFFPLGTWVQPPTGSYGADTPDSKRRLLNLAQASGLIDSMALPKAVAATREDLLRIHPAQYIDRFKAASDADGGDLGQLAPFSKGGYEIACISAGLGIAAVEAIVTGQFDNAYALCRPAGHHCLPDMPMGFCLLCNIPIAIEAARARHGVGKVAVLDWDVHHGNGTQHVYYERGDTLTISLHQDRCFPPGYSGNDERGAGDGAGTNINIPLPAGSGHQTYLRAMQNIVLPALTAFKPDVIIVASGLDANAVDPLARMLLHSETYRELTRMVMGAAAQLCAGRLVVIHEGGYAEAYVPFCGHAVLETLSEVRTAVEDQEIEMFSLWQPGPRVQAFQNSWVDDLTKEFGL
ncbi:MAG: class II histone deacetylase [Myxococcota bacterium]